MATYAIGDIQGCFTTLERLLRRIDFDPKQDRLWLVGDLVNRGPSSLEVLRWAKSMGDRLTVVLGNHDLHLIARAEGAQEPKRRDTLDRVLEAPDRDALIEWLIGRPLLHREGDFVLVHAGLHPEWSLSEAESAAWEAQEALRSRRRHVLLSGALSPSAGRVRESRSEKRRGWGPAALNEGALSPSAGRVRESRPPSAASLSSGGQPPERRARAALREEKRRGWGPAALNEPEGPKTLAPIRFSLDVFTKMRTLQKTGELCLDFKGAPREAPEGCIPWFELCSFPPQVTVLFGHWAALGLHLGRQAIGLDTGCAWGRTLTALRLEDRQVFQERSELAH